MEYLEKEFEFDTKVYRHFLEKFDRRVEDFGAKKMSVFVRQLKEIDKYVEKKCLVELESSGTIMTPLMS